jgi:hypothetical protein
MGAKGQQPLKIGAGVRRMTLGDDGGSLYRR